MSGNRAASVGNAIRSSMRASSAPMHRWKPWPKARWEPDARVRSMSFPALPGGLGQQELAGAADGTDRADATGGHVEARGRQRAERLALLVRQPEEVADHQERDREREGRDEIDGVGGPGGRRDLVDLA